MAQAFLITPVSYTAFEDESEQVDKCKEWGLLSDKAVKLKTFHYKGSGMNTPCTIVGYVDDLTAVIQIDKDQLHCIHPSYLKEMQASSYGVKSSVSAPEAAVADTTEELVTAAFEEAMAPESDEPVPASQPAAEVKPSAKSEAAPPKAKKAKKEKLQLPEEKVSMTARIQEFTTVPNHFSDNDDEVIIYEAVAIIEPAMELEAAWSSYSATLKKLELEVGDTITFEAKVVAKKLTKHPVPYKINNPSKLKKEQA